MAERKTISVEIFGKAYVVRADADPEYTKMLARYVDERMQEVATQSRAVDTQKVAVLAALNITNQLFQMEKQEKEKEVELEQRADRILQLFENVS